MDEKTENDVKESVEMINERMQILKGIRRLVDQEIERASDTAFSDSDMEIDAYVSTNQAYNAALLSSDSGRFQTHESGSDQEHQRQALARPRCPQAGGHAPY